MNLARLGNKYLTDNEPWKIFKTDPVRVGTIINISLQICAALATYASPFCHLPLEKLLRMLALDLQKWDDAAQADALKPGHKINLQNCCSQKLRMNKYNFRLTSLIKPKRKTNQLKNWLLIP
jgi:methionyl-tRNA synthetase